MHFKASGAGLTRRGFLLRSGALAGAAAVAACGAPEQPAQMIVPGYGEIVDGEFTIPAVPPDWVPEVNRRVEVPYAAPDPSGRIIVDPFAKLLYLVGATGTAMRYRIAVGQEGRAFRGQATVGRKQPWPYWTPTRNMIRTQPELYADKAGGMPPGVDNPLGARALYLYRGSRDTMFRIHGTGDYTSIGKATSAGCIRLYNQDILDLYERVATGALVRVRTLDESVAIEGPQVEVVARADAAYWATLPLAAE
jgi:lipoprotein-anchoring transpeptidase ErfK/SrfK